MPNQFSAADLVNVPDVSYDAGDKGVSSEKKIVSVAPFEDEEASVGDRYSTNTSLGTGAVHVIEPAVLEVATVGGGFITSFNIIYGGRFLDVADPTSFSYFHSTEGADRGFAVKFGTIGVDQGQMAGVVSNQSKFNTIPIQDVSGSGLGSYNGGENQPHALGDYVPGSGHNPVTSVKIVNGLGYGIDTVNYPRVGGFLDASGITHSITADPNPPNVDPFKSSNV